MITINDPCRCVAVQLITRRRRPIDDLFVIQNILVDAGNDVIDRMLHAHAGARSGVSMLAYTEHLAVLLEYANENNIEVWRLRDCVSQMERGVYPRDRRLDVHAGNDQLLAGL